MTGRAGAVLTLVLAAVVAAGCTGGSLSSMNTDQATALLDPKAREAFALLPPGTPTPVPQLVTSLNCSDENQPPEVEGVSMSRDYVMRPLAEALARRAVDDAFAAYTARGFLVVVDDRDQLARGFTVQDPADEFRTAVRASENSVRLTVAIISPCVAPAPGFPGLGVPGGFAPPR